MVIERTALEERKIELLGPATLPSLMLSPFRDRNPNGIVRLTNIGKPNT
jgi:hypothetical protein